jgi:hypothetical protein
MSLEFSQVQIIAEINLENWYQHSMWAKNPQNVFAFVSSECNFRYYAQLL